MESNNNNFESLNAHLPYSQACENNKQAILEVLKTELVGRSHVLEVGSGTGQHSVYFAPNMSHLQWQTSDVLANHHAIKAWHDAYPAPNLHMPLAFDINDDSIPISENIEELYDTVFTANTLHIISWSLVTKLIKLVGDALPVDSKLIIYGPFNENGQHTSEGNRQFDTMLRQGNPNSGIRDKEDVVNLASKNALILDKEYVMPANNQILVFKKLPLYK